MGFTELIHTAEDIRVAFRIVIWTETDRTDRKDLVEENHNPGPDVIYDVEFDEDDDLASRRDVETIPLPTK